MRFFGFRALILVTALAVATPALALDAPANFHVTGSNPTEISLAWNAPSPPVSGIAWNVYRDNTKLNTYPIYMTSYTDANLAPETPHVYTVEAFTATETSRPSYVGGTTQVGTVRRVPSASYPTIAAAMATAGAGTSIHVAPGTYTEEINFMGRGGITVKGQDANGCVLDYSATPGGVMLDLYQYYGTGANTVSGFTIYNPLIVMGVGDVIADSVVFAQPIDAFGGLLAHCVLLPSMNAVRVMPGAFFASVNSIYFGYNSPFYSVGPDVLLLNNDFADWSDPFDDLNLYYPGADNILEPPWFEFDRYYTGSYFTMPSYPTFAMGFKLLTPPPPWYPDIGAFADPNRLYTPKPPANLVATFEAFTNSVRLTWDLSPNDAYGPRVRQYFVYRTTAAQFPSDLAYLQYPYAYVPAGTGSFIDVNVDSQTYSYQVRAALYSPTDPISAPTNTASATVDVNDPPVARSDAYTVLEGLTLTVAAPGVLGNDSDPDGDPLAALIDTWPLNGSVVLQLDGSFQYTPDPGFSGMDSFTYVADDGQLLSPPVPVTITVTAVPAPVNLQATAGPAHVTLTWQQPAPPPAGVAWDVYRDGVKITPSPLTTTFFADGPLAPETPHVYQVVALSGGASSQPSDPVGTTTAVGMVLQVPTTAYPTIQAAINAAGPGASIHVAPGTYSSEPIWLGGKSGITVKGQDANGCVLDYTSGIRQPIDLGYGDAGNTLAGFTIRNNTVNMYTGDVVTECVLANDFRYSGPVVGGGGLVAQSVIDTMAQPSMALPPGFTLAVVNTIYLGGQLFSAADLSAGTVLLLNNDFPSWWGYEELPGSGNFSDAPAFDAPYPPFTYRPAVTSPIYSRGLPLETPYVSPDVGAFQIYDPYTPQPPQNLTAGLVPGYPGLVHLQWQLSVDDPGRMLEYFVYRSTTPDFAVVPTGEPYGRVLAGTDFFEDGGLVPDVTYYYQVRAWAGEFGYPTIVPLISAPTGTASVTWVNNPPVAVADVATTLEGTSVTVSVLANDSDPDPWDALTVSAVGMASNGDAFRNPDDTVTYSPAPGFSGADSFTYTVTDMFGGTATATVTVTVSATAPPVAYSQTRVIAEDNVADVVLAAYDPDSGALAFTVTTLPANGTLTGTAPVLTYTPNPNFSGSDSFTFVVSDGVNTSAPGTVTINVTPVNDPPVAVNDLATTAEDQGIILQPLQNDSDPEGNPLVITWVSSVPHASLTFSATSVTVVPDPNYHGVVGFSYLVADGQGGETIASVTLTITPVNDAPLAALDPATTSEDVPVTVAVLANDTDADGDPLSVVAVGTPAHGSASTDGATIRYTPAPNYFGNDSFSYTVNDGCGGTATGTVIVVVTMVNDVPVLVDDAATTVEDVPVVIDVYANDSDADGEPFQGAGYTSGAHGSVTSTSACAFCLEYRPHANFAGTDSFTYSVFDGNGGIATATVTITVTPVNDAPSAAADSYATPEDAALVVAAPGLLANDSDPDGDTLGAVLASGPLHGTLALNLNGSFTYTPNPDFSGTDSFTYTAGDLWATAPDATVTITVTPVNDPPVAVDDTAATAAYVPALITLLGNDGDGDGDALSVVSATQGTNGATVLQGGGSVLYTPNPGFTGTDGFSYTVTDGNGGVASATVVVTVRPQLLRIASLTMATETVTTATGRTNTTATATALAVDEAGSPVAGVSISGRWSELTSDLDSAITGDDGTAAVSSDPKRNARGTFTFTIDAAFKAGYELDPSSVLTGSIQYPAPPPPPPPGGTMHVASIDMGIKTGKGSAVAATATVTVVDASGAPVASASVSGSWSGAITEKVTVTGTTGGDGKVTLSSPGVKNASGKTFTFTVDGVALNGWTYDPAANAETSDSITAP